MGFGPAQGGGGGSGPTTSSLSTVLGNGNATGGVNISLSTGDEITSQTALTIQAPASNVLNLGAGGANNWQVTAGGNLIPATDNTYSIGTSASAGRVANIFA